MSREWSLEDMCECHETYPFRKILEQINTVYENFLELKGSPLPTKDYFLALSEIKAELANSCELYDRIKENKLDHGILIYHQGRASCSRCKTEVAEPNSEVIACFWTGEKQINNYAFLN